MASRRAIEVVEGLAAENPNVIAFQDELALAIYDLGLMETNFDRLSEAHVLLERSRTIEAKAIAVNPERSDEYRIHLAQYEETLAFNRLAAGRPADSVTVGLRVVDHKVQGTRPALTYRSAISRQIHSRSPRPLFIRQTLRTSWPMDAPTHVAVLPTAAITPSSVASPSTPSANSGSRYPNVIKYHAKAQNSLASAPAA
jgi:hypothetical protein